MIQSADAGFPLTSLSISTRQRCSKLLPNRGVREHAYNAGLLALALILPIIAAVLGAHSLKLGLGFVVCVGLVATVIIWPLVGGLVLVGLVPTLSGLEPGYLVPNVRISEALIGLIGVTTLLATRRISSVKWGSLEWLLLAYGLTWAMLGVYDSVSLGEKLTLTTLGTVFGQLQFFLLYRAVRVTVRTKYQQKTALAILALATIPMALLAVLQEVGFGGLRVTLSQITGNTSPLQTSGIIRATGLFGNWASLAGYLFPILVVLVALALAGLLRKSRIALAVAALMVLSLLLTTEISVTICLVLSILVLGIQYGRSARMLTWLGVAVAIAILVLGPVLGARLNSQFGADVGSSHSSLVPQTVAFRENVWTQQYLPAVAERPLDGYGVQIPSTIQWPYPESQYIAILIEGGYPLLIMYLLLLWGMFDQARRIAKSSDPLDRALGRSLVLCVISLVALGITWPFVSNGGLPQVLWCLFGIAVPTASRLDQSHRLPDLINSKSTITEASAFPQH
jgi:hypothetical protein